MIEIRLDNELVGYYDELREALLQVIYNLTADGSATLDKNYKKYKRVVFIYLIIINILLEALFIGKLLI